ncbi:hypothetical protein PFICI_03663 [Pestalotiopsis fici W106-1]|uniref:HRDC domain-containing protein n=1 Tax=Pestalotiopsis fici (strain W106-1 / CGMCC3.15140) TaxID=1229662 RepID=W3XHT5_PESFW|nr:uncharacterized protein PFICI_03663 [Pestalotiopsis fici W106-1]ETS85638.1 hypothetical protein PFICI_03663 [Pestalotiopsis fici W106-1]
MNDSRSTGESATAPRWPLTFRATFGAENQNNNGQHQHNQPPKPRWWTHTLYRGANGQLPRILYSNTKAQSEEIAKEFLGEAVLGFDMEWPWPDKNSARLQDKVSLIQIASESKIALFHVALHGGNTVDELLAPSLKKIIESPDIIKVGVKIQDADFARLRQHMGLQPRSGFELSHLFTLVKFGLSEPDKLRTNLVALARQVEEILGLPLCKDNSVRKSDWSKPLRQGQMVYAADDAYAGYMLYHCLNAKRAQMQPSPPLPVVADHYKTYDGPGFPTRGAIRLQVPATASEYFARFSGRTGVRAGAPPPTLVKSVSFSGNGERSWAEDSRIVIGQNGQSAIPGTTLSVASPPKIEQKLPERLEKQLYYRLVERRQQYARELNFDGYMVAHNSVLESMSKSLPVNKEELLLIKGIGPKKVEQYGPGWLEVIQKFMKEHKNDVLTTTSEAAPRGLKRSVSFTSPQKQEARAPPALHTGLSFQMDSTSIIHPPYSDDEEESDTEGFGPPLSTTLKPRVNMRNGNRIDYSAVPQSQQELSTPRVKRSRSDMDDNAVTPSVQNPAPAALNRHIDAETSTRGLEQRDFRRSRSYHQETGSHSSREAQEYPVSASQPTDVSYPRSSSNSNAEAVSQTLEERLRELSKQVSVGNSSILSAMTIRWIASTPPTSNQELLVVPGVQPFVRACNLKGINLFDTITGWLRNQ